MTSTNVSTNTLPVSDSVDSQLEVASNGSNGSEDEVDVSVWFRSGQRKTGYIQGRTFDVKEVQYSEIDGDAILEGDILLGSIEEMEQFAEMVRSGEVPRGVGITRKENRWTDGIVAYTIDKTVTEEQRNSIRNAIKHWAENTLIRFEERTPANEQKFPNYVQFENVKSGCFATLGMVGKGKQIINLSNECYRGGIGTVIHEIGHTVGLYHEQSREDRDKFVRIIEDKIEFTDENKDGKNDTFVVNFSQVNNDGDDIGEYDYDSIMHYPSTAFGKGGATTIDPLDPDKEAKRKRMGQRKGLSPGDIAAVQHMYQGIAKPMPTPTPNPPPVPPTPNPTPTPPPVPTPSANTIVPVYQYYAKTPVWRYLYSATKSDDFIRDGWALEGVVFRAFSQAQPGAVPVYRYVAKEPWRYQLSRESSIGQGWTNEGVAFYAYAKPESKDFKLPEKLQPIYQYYALDEDGGWRYQYSTKSNLADGWKSEGVAFYALLPKQ